MKGIQNKIIVSQKAFIIHIYGLHHNKGKLSNIFWLYNFLNRFQCGLPWLHDKYPDGHRDIGLSDFVHRPKAQYLCELYTIVRTL
jgi:hypothetical protein